MIAIVGGGIGGAAAAAFLRRAGLAAVVYEQAAELTEVGAGLVLTPNAVRLLRRLEVMDQLADHAVPDGPEQQARDQSLAAADPLAASAWIYAYDALG